MQGKRWIVTAALMLSLGAAASGWTQIVVDNGSADFSTGGTWTASTSTPGYYGSNYLTDGSAGVDTGKWAKWRPTFPTTAGYTVYARWPAASNRPSSVKYRIYHQGTVTDIWQNQQVNGGTWISLGTYTFAAGNSDNNRVTLDAGSAAGYVVADAVQFTGGGASATPTTPPSSGSARTVPYVDISLGTGSQVASNAAAAGLGGVTLAFLIDGGCTATWGGGLGNVSNAMFPSGTSVKSAINSLTGAGRKVIISWGGANGSVLSSCGSASAAQAMYQSVFNAYPNISGQDFDIEGGVNTTVLAQALAGLKNANPGKSVSLTLPVLPTGLVSAGLSIVNACHSAGFHPTTINVMAMDYGSAVDNGGNMLLSAQQAAQNTHNQTGDNIGITPMIGVNDTSTEIFTLSNASSLVSWAKGQSYVNRLAFWSLSRDNGGCAGQTFASATCSGVSQSTWQFSSIFRGF